MSHFQTKKKLLGDVQVEVEQEENAGCVVQGISQVTNEVLLFQYTKVTQTKAKVRNSLEKKGKKWGGKERNKEYCLVLS